VQQFGFAMSAAQSEGCVQRWNVSVAMHESWMFDTQPDVHCVDSDCVVQVGKVPPFTTSVAQQSGALPAQSLGLAHVSVSAGLHEDAQLVPASMTRQQTWPPEHGVVGQVEPASTPPEVEPPEPLPLPVLPDPLLLPELLVLAAPLLVPELLALPELLVLPELLPPLPLVLPEIESLPASTARAPESPVPQAVWTTLIITAAAAVLQRNSRRSMPGSLLFATIRSSEPLVRLSRVAELVAGRQNLPERIGTTTAGAAACWLECPRDEPGRPTVAPSGCVPVSAAVVNANVSQTACSAMDSGSPPWS
jgi:hypothetical protein